MNARRKTLADLLLSSSPGRDCLESVLFVQATSGLQFVVSAMPSTIFPAGLDGRTMAVRLLAALHPYVFTAHSESTMCCFRNA